jgi:L-lactate dehydrogenase complex protein LldE
MNVAFFVTCLTDTFYPRAGIAAVKVLEKLGCTVSFPREQTCCGQPMFNNGFHGEAAALARRMVAMFEPFDHVVTPSGSCAAMVHEHYAGLLADDAAYAEGARRLARNTHEFHRFLVDVLRVDLGKLGVRWPGRVTYHYACHQRGIGVKSPATPDTADAPLPTLRQGSAMSPEADPAVRLMRQIEGLELLQLPRADQCCGFGGTFATKMPMISGAMVRDKVQCIASTGAPTCVCNEGGCTLNISGAAHREGVPVRFTTFAEIIAEGMGILPPS